MLMLQLVNAILGELLVCAVTPSQQTRSSSIRGFVPMDSLQDPASLNQQSTDRHWKLYTAPGDV